MPLEQCLEVLDHPLNARSFKQFGRILEKAADKFRPLRQAERQIKSCRPAIDIERAGGQAADSHVRGFRKIYEDECDLKNGVAARVRRRLQLLDQFSEGYILMRIRA